MIDIVITSFNEPKATLRAVQTFLKQDIPSDYRIIVVDPFPEVGEFIKKNVKSKKVEFFLDPGEGKNYAMNLLFEQYYSTNKEDIMIFTDGDVFVSNNAVADIFQTFKDPKVGAITARPVPVDTREKKFGYWAHVLTGGINMVRNRYNSKKVFFQCSGYLFAIRKGIINEIPLDVPEDAIIPYFIWKAGYEIRYLSNVEVYVKYPSNWADWINQRIRTIKAHENLSKSFPDMPRTKSFFKEVKEGMYPIKQCRSIPEFFWTTQLYFARLYIYYRAFADMKQNKKFNPAWREDEVASAKPLD